MNGTNFNSSVPGRMDLMCTVYWWLRACIAFCSKSTAKPADCWQYLPLSVRLRDVDISPPPARRSLPSTMSSSDAGRVAGRTSPFPSTRRSGTLSPPPSASLTDQHLAEALVNSPDNGATLDFTHKSLTDVGEDGAEHLATASRSEFSTEPVSITRSALLLRHAHGAN